MRRARFAQAQVEWVQVQVAQVLQGTKVQRALQVLGHGLLVQQLHLVAHAPTLRLRFEGLQLTHMRGLHRRMQVTALEVAGDAVALDPLFDNLMPAPAQMPDEVIDVFTKFFTHLFAHGFVAREATGDLAAVTPAGAPTNPVGLDDGDLQAAFGQLDGAGHPGKTTADDRDVNLDRAFERRVLGGVVEAGGVVGGTALSSAGIHGCVHKKSLAQK
ncbi:hypothetical protein D3C80_362920 [compost metagenome]